MKHVILPYNAQQALELIHQLQAIIDVLHNAYQLDFIDMATHPNSQQENLDEPFDDPLDF